MIIGTATLTMEARRDGSQLIVSMYGQPSVSHHIKTVERNSDGSIVQRFDELNEAAKCFPKGISCDLRPFPGGRRFGYITKN